MDYVKDNAVVTAANNKERAGRLLEYAKRWTKGNENKKAKEGKSHDGV